MIPRVQRFPVFTCYDTAVSMIPCIDELFQPIFPALFLFDYHGIIGPRDILTRHCIFFLQVCLILYTFPFNYNIIESGVKHHSLSFDITYENNNLLTVHYDFILKIFIKFHKY